MKSQPTIDSLIAELASLKVHVKIYRRGHKAFVSDGVFCAALFDRDQLEGVSTVWVERKHLGYELLRVARHLLENRNVEKEEEISTETYIGNEVVQ